jgi:hypothetical protein
VFAHHFVKHISNVKTVKDAIAGGHGVYDDARGIWVYGWEPGGADPDRMVLAHEKMSARAKEPSSLFERAVAPHLADPNDPDWSLSLVRLVQEEVPYTALGVAKTVNPSDAPTEMNDESPKSVILTTLAELDDMSAAELEELRAEHGFKPRQWNDARAALKKDGAVEDFAVYEDGKKTATRWRKTKGPVVSLVPRRPDLVEVP